MSATTASTGQSVPVSLEAMRRVMIELQLAAPPEWMLIAPDGRVFKGDQRTVARALLMNIDVASLFGATPAAPLQEPAVPQGNDPAWTLAAKVREALDRKACPGYYMDVAVEAVVHNYAPAAPSQEPAVPQGEPSLDLIAVCKEVSAMAVYVGDGECSIQFAIIQRLDAALAATPAAPSQTVACGLCQGSGVLSPTQKCICQYGGQEPSAGHQSKATP